MLDRLASGISPLVENLPELKLAWEYRQWLYVHDVFKKIEPWQDGYFAFKGLEEADPRYGFAYKQLTVNYLNWRYIDAFLIEAAAKKQGCRFHGISDETLELCRAFFGPQAAPGVKAQWRPCLLINALSATVITLAAWGWILSRLRINPRPEEVFLIADNNNDPRDIFLYEELADGGPIVLLARNKNIMETQGQAGKAYHQCMRGDGVFSMADGLRAMAMVLKDGAALFTRHGRRQPAHFYEIAAMAFKRTFLRALFNRFRPQYFWGRDDYNVEHVIRRQELHRIGARSHGIGHAVQGICILMPQMRYVSFDTYYVMGEIFYKRYYKDTWARDMTVKAVGTFGLTREQLATMREPGENILVMTRFAVGNPEYIRTVRAIAKAFPDRKVLLQIKGGLSYADEGAPTHIEACRQGLNNVVSITGDIYELLRSARYALSDASTIIAEAIQLGVPIYMMDVIPGHKSAIFRNFPGLCLTKAEQAVAELEALESGKKTYPRDDFAELIDLSDAVIYDTIRRDMGLDEEFDPGLGK